MRFSASIQATAIICIAYLATLNGSCFVQATPQFFGTVAGWVNNGRAFVNELKAATLESVGGGSRSFRGRLLIPRRLPHHMRRIQPRSLNMEFGGDHRSPEVGPNPSSSSSFRFNEELMTPKQRRQFERRLMESFSLHGGMRRGFRRRKNQAAVAEDVGQPATQLEPFDNLWAPRLQEENRRGDTRSNLIQVPRLGQNADIADQIDNAKTFPSSARQSSDDCTRTVNPGK